MDSNKTGTAQGEAVKVPEDHLTRSRASGPARIAPGETDPPGPPDPSGNGGTDTTATPSPGVLIL